MRCVYGFNTLLCGVYMGLIPFYVVYIYGFNTLLRSVYMGLIPLYGVYGFNTLLCGVYMDLIPFYVYKWVTCRRYSDVATWPSLSRTHWGMPEASRDCCCAPPEVSATHCRGLVWREVFIYIWYREGYGEGFREGFVW
jgi:hypothetical protein